MTISATQRLVTISSEIFQAEKFGGNGGMSFYQLAIS